MKNAAVKSLAVTLIVWLLMSPAGLSAKERRGAKLIVTRLDGSRVSGELIAVKPDSLLLLGEGKDISIGLADVRTVAIVRKSKAGLLAGIGGAAGALGGALLGLSWGGEGIAKTAAGDAVLMGLSIGAAGALAGYLGGTWAGRDPTFTVAGRPEADAARFWDRLRAHSREGALPTPGALAGVDAGTPGGRRDRFRLSVSAALPTGIAQTPFDELYSVGSFYFPYETAPEAGPYSTWMSGSFNSGPVRIGLGPVVLAYEWRPHWSVDAELFTSGQSSCSWAGPLEFTSSDDGQTYSTYFYHGYDVRFTSLLLGLSYHPLLRDSLQRHDIEIGAAAGPVLVSGTPYASDVAGPYTLPSFGEIGFSGRVQAAYDYSFASSWSLGVFAGYRFMEKDLTGVVASGTGTFRNPADPAQTPVFQRQVEVSLPALSLKASGGFVGLRIGFRI